MKRNGAKRIQVKNRRQEAEQSRLQPEGFFFNGFLLLGAAPPILIACTILVLI